MERNKKEKNAKDKKQAKVEKRDKDKKKSKGEKQDKKGRMTSWVKWLLSALGLLVVICLIPLGINMCYKTNKGCITVWNGADMLGYCGTILSAVIGAAVVVLTVAFTISFSRKQIQRDAYLRDEKEKWGKIESAIGDALDSINPRRVLLARTETLAEADNSYPDSVLSMIQKYQFDCRVSTDHLCTCISSVDIPKIETLVTEIENGAKEFYDIAQREFELYQCIRDEKARSVAWKIMNCEAQYPNSITDEVRNLAPDILEKTSRWDSGAVNAEIENESGKMVRAYETTYRQLLFLKGQTFNTIYSEIQKNADDILRFRRKNHANP